MSGFTTVDAVVIAVYITGVTAWGVWLGRGQEGATDYFLGGHDLPWGAVLFSVVATETSTLTFLSIPGLAYATDLSFLQITVGYFLGRLIVAFLFLPAYFRGDLATAYALLERSLRARHPTLRIRHLHGHACLCGWRAALRHRHPARADHRLELPRLDRRSIGVLTLLYTFYGGIRSVVWMDTLQMIVYVGGAIAALFVLAAQLEGGWSGLLSSAG